ncbi:ABC transporter substrate-binding protein [Mesorhizobium intechi]|uniref:ABC transporter substrate-binding protein n=1 Tax=Mesorhizobium intechi TaxID=537601 RepID=UPI00142F101F|nr:ABC transporter substrate-binding protein [Mesorhizobium intechi]
MPAINGKVSLLAGAISCCAAALAAHYSTNSANAAEPEIVSRAPAASSAVDSIVWNLPFGEPSTLDPPNAPTLSGAGVVSNLCDALVTIDENYNLSGNIATFKVVNPNKIVYKIRTDVKFWDGSPVTAEDVAFSLKRAAEPAQIVSFLFQNVSSIDVTAPDEVTVSFSKPGEMFNAEMATFAGMIMKKSYVDAAGKSLGTATGGLMCSGPFKLDGWKAGDSIVITRNDAYWNKQRIPLAKKVTFTFVTDTAAYVQAMKAGEIDGSYEVSPSAIPALQGINAGRLFYGPSMQSIQLQVASPSGPLADLKLREAFQSLIDRDAIAKVVYKDAAVAQYTALAPATWQNDAREIYAAAYPEFEKSRAFDVARAQSLVKESTYQGEPIVLAISAGEETTVRVAQLIQQQAKKVGVNVTIKQMQPLEFSEAQYDAAKRTGIDFVLGTNFNAAQDPLEPTGFVYLPGGFYNLSGFDDPEVTRLINESRQNFDPKERAKMFVQMQDIYEKQSGTIPIVSQRTVTFLNKRLAGAVTSFGYLSMPALAFVGSAQ